MLSSLRSLAPVASHLRAAAVGWAMRYPNKLPAAWVWGSIGVKGLQTGSTPSAPGDSMLPRTSVHAIPTFGDINFDDEARPASLSAKDQALIRLYVAGCNHYWNMMPELARSCYHVGATSEEVWSTVRHLIVFAGYAPCLAATIHLRKHGMLKGEAPGKVGGPPGNAFELVYDKVTDVVRGKLHDWDPVLSEYIRLHLYGDVYSSPGLTMAQKQLLTVAFLGEANMHDQLYTHLIAAMRFGNTREACERAIKTGFHMSPRPNLVLRPILRSAMRALDNAESKAPVPPALGVSPEVHIPDPNSVCVPPPPVKTNIGKK